MINVHSLFLLTGQTMNRTGEDYRPPVAQRASVIVDGRVIMPPPGFAYPAAIPDTQFSLGAGFRQSPGRGFGPSQALSNNRSGASLVPLDLSMRSVAPLDLSLLPPATTGSSVYQVPAARGE